MSKTVSTQQMTLSILLLGTILCLSNSKSLPSTSTFVSSTNATTIDTDVVDVVVFGATPSGIAAALAAKRHSGHQQRVVILEPSKWFGGMMAGGLGCTDKVGEGSVGGIAREFINRTQAKYPPNRTLPHCTRAFAPSVATTVFAAMMQEDQVEIHTSATLVAAEKNGTKIRSVTVNVTHTLGDGCKKADAPWSVSVLTVLDCKLFL